MNKLTEKVDGKYITTKRDFNALGVFKSNTIESTFDFAYDMSFGEKGEHRNHRSGGTHCRKNGEIFANTFQGKLAEFAFYNMTHRDLSLKLPDLKTWELGKWDDTDFIVNGYKINIKSTKAFGNLLLLETKDWNDKGQYIPNLEKGSAVYDFFVLIRTKPFCEEILRNNRLLYADTVDKEELRKLIVSEQWEFDIVGWIDHSDLLEVIKCRQIIAKGELLNGKTKIDADNYYIQSGDMKEFDSLIVLLKRKKPVAGFFTRILNLFKSFK